jgi:3-hydroxyisobutyrate dehydrogenase-like beta-hydroxyacid dehydrogenase
MVESTLKEAAERIAAGRVTSASSVDDAVANADIIFYCLPSDEAVMTVLAKVLKSNVKGKVIVDCSTVHPDTSTKETDLVNAQGAQFVACPVFGSPLMAKAVQCNMAIAGSTEAVDKIRPYCSGVMAKAVIDFSGQSPSQASLMKIVGNTFVLNAAALLSEGLVLAEKTGLGAQQLQQFVAAVFPGANPFSAYSAAMVSGNYHRRDKDKLLGAAKLAKKDSSYAQALAAQCDMELRLVGVLQQYVDKLIAEKGPESEIAAIYGIAREAAGLPFENH